MFVMKHNQLLLGSCHKIVKRLSESVRISNQIDPHTPQKEGAGGVVVKGVAILLYIFKILFYLPFAN